MTSPATSTTSSSSSTSPLDNAVIQQILMRLDDLERNKSQVPPQMQMQQQVSNMSDDNVINQLQNELFNL